MARQKRFYNPELETTELYTEVWQPELVKVRDVTDLLVISHYWRDSTGELWGDFEDPMENVKNGLTAYRKRQQYLQPAEILQIRNSLGMTVQDFADHLGINATTYQQIESNQRLQTKEQEKIFRTVE